jgi:hypothetical protein
MYSITYIQLRNGEEAYFWWMFLNVHLGYNGKASAILPI